MHIMLLPPQIMASRGGYVFGLSVTKRLHINVVITCSVINNEILCLRCCKFDDVINDKTNDEGIAK